MDITYYYRPSLLMTPEQQVSHQRIHALLDQLSSKGNTCAVEEADKKFPTPESQTEFLEQIRLRDFATRRHIKLRQEFGSRKHSFCWLPAQFVLHLSR